MIDDRSTAGNPDLDEVLTDYHDALHRLAEAKASPAPRGVLDGLAEEANRLSKQVQSHPDADQHLGDEARSSYLDTQLPGAGNAGVERLSRLEQMPSARARDAIRQSRAEADRAHLYDDTPRVPAPVESEIDPATPQRRGAGLPGSAQAGPGSDPMPAAELRQRSAGLVRQLRQRTAGQSIDDFAHQHRGALGGSPTDLSGDSGNVDALAGALRSMESREVDLDDTDSAAGDLADLLGERYQAALPAQRRTPQGGGSVTGNDAYPGSGDVPPAGSAPAPEDEPGWGTVRANRSHVYRRNVDTGAWQQHPRSPAGEWSEVAGLPPSARNVSPRQVASDLGGRCLDCGKELDVASATGYGPKCVTRHR